MVKYKTPIKKEIKINNYEIERGKKIENEQEKDSNLNN